MHITIGVVALHCSHTGAVVALIVKYIRYELSCPATQGLGKSASLLCACQKVSSSILADHCTTEPRSTTFYQMLHDKTHSSNKVNPQKKWYSAPTRVAGSKNATTFLQVIKDTPTVEAGGGGRKPTFVPREAVRC